MTNSGSKNHVYILACPRDDGSLSVLCRNSGSSPGPSYCNSKKSAMMLKTRLTNDPRGIANHRALELIKSLLVYKIDASLEPVWEEGALWAYLPQERAKCVEGSFNF